MADTKQPEDLQEWLSDLKTHVDATRGELAEVRDLVGDPDVAAVSQALQAAAVTYGPVRVAQLECLDPECFARCAEHGMTGFWRALAAAAIGAMGDSMPQTGLSMPLPAQDGPEVGVSGVDVPGGSEGLSADQQREDAK